MNPRRIALAALLVTGALAAPAMGQQDPAALLQPPVDVTAPETVQQAVPSKAPKGLKDAIIIENSVRVGGRGHFSAEVAQVHQPGIDAHKVQLRISTGRNTRILRARGGAWRCAPAGSATTWLCKLGSIRGTQVVPAVNVTVEGLPGLKPGKVPVSTHLSWVEKGGTPQRVAAHMQREQALGRTPTRAVTGRDSTHDFLPVSPPLAIVARIVGPAIHPMGQAVETHTGTIHATVGGMDGDSIQLRWTQRCLTRADAQVVKRCNGKVGPKAEFVDPAVSTLSEPQVGMRVHLPAVRRPTPLVFDVSVNDTGDVARDQVVIIPTPIAAVKYASRNEAFQAMLTQAKPAGDLTRPAGVRTRTASTGMREKRSRDGKWVTLTPRVPGGIKSVTWSAPVGGSMAGVKRQGDSITVPTGAGASQSGGAKVYEAKVVTKSGDVVQVPKTVPPAQPATPTRPRLTLPAPPQQQPLCGAIGAQNALPTAASIGDGSATPDISLPGGAKVWLGTVQSSGACDVNTEATFTGGVVLFGTWGLQRVTGTISARGGVSITGGAMRVPEQWLAGAPQQFVDQMQGAAAQVPFTLPKGMELNARLDATGKWSAMGGEFVLPGGLDLIALPGGWTFQPARLRVEPTGRVGVTMEARAPPGQAGSVVMSGGIALDGSLDLDVTAAGVAVFTSGNGDQAVVNMQGALRITPAKDGTGNPVTPARSVWDVQVQGQVTNVRPFDNVLFRTVTVIWSAAGLEMTADMRIGDADRGIDLKGSGKYVSADDWSIDVDWSGNWGIGKGASIATLKGSLVRKGGYTTLDAKGTATGWKPSDAFELQSLTASISNACTEADKSKCNPLAVNVALEAKGGVSVAGGSPISWDAAASVNLKTGEFRVSGGLSVPDGGIGPEALKLRSINVAVANDGDKAVCAPKQAQATPGTRLSISATGTVLGQAVDFTGEFESGTGGGYCLIGRMRDMPSNVPNAKSFNDILVAYSSREASISGEVAGNRTVALPAQQLVLNAQFQMPDFMKQVGVEGKGTFNGTVGLSPVSIDATVTFKSADRTIFIGEASGSNLGLDDISIGFAWANGALTFDASANMSYVTPGNDTVGPSTTPLKVSVGVTAGANGGSVFLDGGVDPTRAGSDGVVNAFGVQDLTVRQMRLTARLGTDVSVSFDGAVQLPDRWVGPIGLKAGTVVTLAANVSQTNPCFQFDISRARPEDGEVVVDFANQGLLGARKMELMLAPGPGGCQLGGTDARVLPQGFSVAFDGVIGKDFNVKVGAQVRLPSPADPTDFYLKADLELDAFDIGGAVSVQQTKMNLLIDVKNATYGLTLKGGVDVMGNKVGVDFDVQAAGIGNVKVTGSGAADISVGGFAFNGYLDINVDIQQGTLKTLQVDLVSKVKVLGVTIADARGALQYDEGIVKKFELSLQITVPLGWKSEAQGSVEVLYELGKAAQNGAAPTLNMPARMLVAVGGRLKLFGGDIGGFRWVIVDWKGTVDQPAPPAPENVDFPMGGTQDVKWNPRLPVLRYHALDYAAGSDMAYDNEGYRDARVMGLTYTANSRTVSQDGAPATTELTGGLTLATCPEAKVSADGRTCSVSPGSVTAVIHFEDKRIQVVGGGVAGVMTYDAGQMKCTAGCTTKDVNLTGGEWDAAVALIEEARTQFAAANKGKVLPPVDAWTYDKQGTGTS